MYIQTYIVYIYIYTCGFFLLYVSMMWCIKDNIKLSIDILNNFIFYLIYFEMAWLCKLLKSVGWSAAASHQKSNTTYSWQVKTLNCVLAGR